MKKSIGPTCRSGASAALAILAIVASQFACSPAHALKVVEATYNRVDRYEPKREERDFLNRTGHQDVVDLLYLVSYPNIWQGSDLAAMAWNELDAMHLSNSLQGTELLKLKEAGLWLTELARQYPKELKALKALKDDQDIVFLELSSAAHGNPNELAALVQEAQVTKGPLAQAALRTIDQLAVAETALRRVEGAGSAENENFGATLVILHSFTPSDAAINIRLAGFQSAADRKTLQDIEYMRMMALFASQGGGENNPDLGKLVILLKTPDLDQLPAILDMARAEIADDAAAQQAIARVASRVAAIRADNASARMFTDLQAKRDALVFQGALATKATPDGDKAFADYKTVSAALGRNPQMGALSALFDDYSNLVVREKTAAAKGDFSAHCAAQILGSFTLDKARINLNEAVGSSEMRIIVPSMSGYRDVLALADGGAKLNQASVVALSAWPRISDWKRESRMAIAGLNHASYGDQLARDLTQVARLSAALRPEAVAYLESLPAHRDRIIVLDQQAKQGNAEARAELSRLAADGNVALNLESRKTVAAFWKTWTPFIRATAGRAAYQDDNAVFVYDLLDSFSVDAAEVRYQNSPRRKEVNALIANRQMAFDHDLGACYGGAAEAHDSSEQDCARRVTASYESEVDQCTRRQIALGRDDPDYAAISDPCGGPSRNGRQPVH